MKSERLTILGFDIGGTKSAAIISDVLSGEVWGRVETPTLPQEGFAPAFQRICQAGDDALRLAKEQGRSATMIGISVGGPVDVDRGIVYSPPNLPGWDEIPIKQLLEQRFGLPAIVEHDGMAGAMAERAYGAAKGIDHLVFLTLGTGLGAGMILNGRPYRGKGGAAGSVGHIRMAEDGPIAWGKVGAWEAFSSGAGIASLARWKYPELFSADVTAKVVAERAKSGDQAARDVLSVSAHYLGRGLAMLIDILAPEMIVLGSLAARLGDSFLKPVLDIVAQETEPSARAGCQIVVSALGARIGDLAPAAAVAARLELVPS